MDIFFVSKLITWTSILGTTTVLICLLFGLGIRLYKGKTTPLSKNISIAGIIVFFNGASIDYFITNPEKTYVKTDQG